jgi:hypothetical protein
MTFEGVGAGLALLNFAIAALIGLALPATATHWVRLSIALIMFGTALTSGIYLGRLTWGA